MVFVRFVAFKAYRKLASSLNRVLECDERRRMREEDPADRDASEGVQPKSGP